ncbi:putative ATP-dependent helicase DinG [Jeotgalicoccus coquinae]|uniref:3'-5' exonuclease DinG n=1 Tax=Jeotgalicoccus coquinae TaxID=709509 RepID=A0A6V7R8T9_9STAP|nr:helicase C-terminal domain-containing protein [Jeotgalicoccus coquinae]MBB6422959.1 ATP-dependent DNA helicase DinG [Jeotgalicoccus coquinae]GGE11799.1 putative ATP-dependent helicase DinG [Jeotgalicoccus coquinae]CAD2073573.1 3'-5' exonuclease DinG [Jeotgalicoccus coquinae]
MLNKTFAVVDLETTGNNLEKDNIIQLSITFVRNFKITGQYNTFLSDETTVSPFIRELTNISSDMLIGAPKFKDVAKDIKNQLDDAVFVAHNVDFDLTFLQSAFKSAGLAYNPVHTLDTVELVRIFLPSVAGYQLHLVAEHLGIELSQAHRADEDAYATAEVLIVVIKKIISMHRETLIKIYHLSKMMRTSLTDLIFSILNRYTNDNDDNIISYNQFYIKETEVTHKNIESITVHDLYHKYLSMTGNEYREDQYRLALLIYDSLVDGKYHAIEAYTGLGKSDAFLIAALSYYSAYDGQVVVSTSRKILQNQLIEESLMRLRKVVSYETPFALLKGRLNYIDLNAFTALLQLDDSNPEICFLKMRMLVWLVETETGDLSEVNLRGPEKSYYETMLIQAGDGKHHFYFKRALSNAKKVPIIVTNHYFLNDCLNNLEGIQALIIDEAHQLKQALDLKERRTFNYPELKFFIGQVGLINQDRLLASYSKTNSAVSLYLLEDIVINLNKNIDLLFQQLSWKKIDDALATLGSLVKFTDMFLSTIRGTDNYQALYNHMHYFDASLKNLRYALAYDDYHIKSSKNFQKSEVTIRTDVLDTLADALRSIPCQILLSGTLEVHGSFKHLKYWFGDYEFKTTIMNNTAMYSDIKLFIPNDISSYDVKDDDYIVDILDYIALYLSETNSKLVVIFSNYELLDRVYSFTEDIELFDEIPVLRQSHNSNNEKLLGQYNQLSQCLLLGTYTFTEGINLVSDKDKALMLTKLPFPVPKGDSFRDFYTTDLPEAVIHFRQIIGRVKRSSEDKGVVLLFDDRIMTKPYKNAFLKYFPEENVIHDTRETFKALLFGL